VRREREVEEGGRQDPEDKIGGGARWCRPRKCQFIRRAIEKLLARNRPAVAAGRRIVGAPAIGRRAGFGPDKGREAHARAGNDA